jgi:hypothetical protein
MHVNVFFWQQQVFNCIKSHVNPWSAITWHYVWCVVCLVQLWLVGIFLFVKSYIHTHLLYTFWHHFCITCPIVSLSSIIKAEHNLLIKSNRIHPKLIITAEFELITHWTFFTLPSTSHWYWISNFEETHYYWLYHSSSLVSPNWT